MAAYAFLGRRWARHPDPTPEEVAPGLVPGGTVVRFYGCPSGQLLFEALLPPGAPDGLPDGETMERLLGPDDHGHIGAYDGDTGERRVPSGPVIFALAITAERGWARNGELAWPAR